MQFTFSSSLKVRLAQMQVAEREAAYMRAVAQEVGATVVHDEIIFTTQAQAEAFAERMGPVRK